MNSSRRPASPQLPSGPWIVLGGMALSCLAGYVNACMLALFHVPVSHTTGAITKLGLDLVEGNHADLVLVGGVLAGFFAGAVLSGLIVGGREIAAGRRYGIALMIEAGILLVTANLAVEGHLLALPTAAFACGLQNAMATSFRGLVVRTTHTTGLMTDLGIYLGRRLRGDSITARPIFLLFFLILGFFIGVVAGGVLAHGAEPRPDAIGWAAWPALAAGATYWFYRQRVLLTRGRDLPPDGL